MLIGFNAKINIGIDPESSEFILGSELLPNLHKILPERLDNSNFLVLMDKNVNRLFGKKIIASLKKTGKKIAVSIIPAGEKAKSMENISKFIKPFFREGINRKSVLIAIGGGVTTDIGGFIASILLRGIDCVYIPTTLLSQIDAAIGGKTGVDLWLTRKTMYKNMIGTIRQPRIVISDTDTLASLPEREIISGIGEMVRYWLGWGKPEISEIIKFKTQMHNKTLLMKVISQCQKIKIETVIKDPMETKHMRDKLNLGHTIGHAIESESHGRLTHGESVAVGLAGVAILSSKSGLITESLCKSIMNNISMCQLPVSVKGLSARRILRAITVDKKGGKFVLIKGIGETIVKDSVDQKLIVETLKEIMI